MYLINLMFTMIDTKTIFANKVFNTKNNINPILASKQCAAVRINFDSLSDSFSLMIVPVQCMPHVIFTNELRSFFLGRVPSMILPLEKNNKSFTLTKFNAFQIYLNRL